MNKHLAAKIVPIGFVLAASLCSCQGQNSFSSESASSSEPSSMAWDGSRVKDERGLDPYQFTQLNISGTDGLGRSLRAGDLCNDNKEVGMFYFLWHGSHETGIYDITQLLSNDPDDLWSTANNAASPVNAFHYWGEPLYGYYRSDDPWVIARHLELMTMSDIDYIVFDTTNAIVYANVVNVLADIFTTYQNQGWKVPHFAFYTHSNSAQTISSIYENWYKTGKYSSLWYRIDGKPVIIGVSSDLSDSEYSLYNDFFTFKEAQWPDAHINKRTGFPWMDWGYPQTDYNGIMNVSLAQHPGYAMSEQALSNWGRGFDFATFENSSARVDEGSNFQQEWSSVFDAEGTTGGISNVFVTGFNEWMAVKQVLGVEKPIFCDTFDEEYSRDIEMMKGGYGDNYYLQLAENVRRYKTSAAKHYVYDERSIDITQSDQKGWTGTKNVYMDFAGEAQARHYDNCARTGSYVDNSNRNDIASVALTHDADNLFIKINCVNDITPYETGDQGWMNVLIDSCNSGKTKFVENYDYLINRFPSANGTTSIEACQGGYAWAGVGSAAYSLSGKTLQISAPLSSLGLSERQCHLRLKVTDNITDPDDISDYYVSGDSAPIGRLSYEYGY